MFFNSVSGKLTQKLPFCLLGKSLLISALQVSLGSVEVRLSVLTCWSQPAQWIERCPRKPDLCQPSKWTADMLKQTFLCQFFLLQQSFANFFFFFPVKNTKVLLLLQNRQFSKILTLFSEVSFSRIQVPNSRP